MVLDQGQQKKYVIVEMHNIRNNRGRFTQKNKNKNKNSKKSPLRNTRGRFAKKGLLRNTRGRFAKKMRD
jgi:hypothetical protein